MSIFHKQGTAHLDIKYENVFKTKISGKDGGPKYKYAIADHTMAFNKSKFMNKLVKKYGENYSDYKDEALKEKIWKDHYDDEIVSKLGVGTGTCLDPENPIINKEQLPYGYNPCIADSYSAGVTIIDYAGILCSIEVDDWNDPKSKSDIKAYLGRRVEKQHMTNILTQLQEKDTGCYSEFKQLVDGLRMKNWKSRLSCTDALNSSFITAKIQ